MTSASSGTATRASPKPNAERISVAMNSTASTATVGQSTSIVCPGGAGPLFPSCLPASFGVAVDGLGREGRQADRDVFSPLVAGCTVADPLAPPHQHGLTRAHFDGPVP